MRLSQMPFIGSTVEPSKAKIISHRLLIQAGSIRRISRFQTFPASTRGKVKIFKREDSSIDEVYL